MDQPKAQLQTPVAPPLERPTLRVQGEDIILESAAEQRGSPVQSQEVGKAEALDTDNNEGGNAVKEERKNDISPASRVPALDLSVLSKQVHSSSRKRLDMIGGPSRVHDKHDELNQRVKDEGRSSSVESFKLSMGGDTEEWNKLTAANLQAFLKSQSPTSRYASLERVKKWIEASSPPYDANPSVGVPKGPIVSSKGHHSILKRICCWKG